MTTACVPVDLRNPGQVFACLGLLEALEVLQGPCFGRFTWVAGALQAEFAVTCEGARSPVRLVLDFLRTCSVTAGAPGAALLSTARWGVSTVSTGVEFPFPLPESPATLPACLIDEKGHRVPIEYWGDSAAAGRDNFKLWAGAGGYPGAALVRDALQLLAQLDESDSAVEEDPFAFSAPQTSSLRFDWRRDYVPLDAGFSPNEHGNMVMVGFPIVELLAAIGLQHARPQRIERNDKLRYCYGVSSESLPTVLVRAVIGGQVPLLTTRKFQMRLGWPGQEGQARCIIDAQEETDQ